MVIFDKDAQDEERQTILDGFERGVGETGGGITHTDIWGLRSFAYEIDHKFEGYYVVQEFTAQGDLSELERPMRLSDSVVRQKIMLIPEEEIERRNELRASGDSTYAIPRPSKRGRNTKFNDAPASTTSSGSTAPENIDAPAVEEPDTKSPDSETAPDSAPETKTDTAPETKTETKPDSAPETKTETAPETDKNNAPEEENPETPEKTLENEIEVVSAIPQAKPPASPEENDEN